MYQGEVTYGLAQFYEEPRKDQRGKTVYIRECLNCGDEFETTRGNKFTCSNDCALRRQKDLLNIRARAKYKKRKG